MLLDTNFFFQTLNRSASHSEELKSELKMNLSKLSYDFVSKTSNLIRKTDATCVSLLLETDAESVAPSHGYVLPANRHRRSDASHAEVCGCNFYSEFAFAKKWHEVNMKFIWNYCNNDFIVDLTFRITTCRSLLAIAFRT